MPLNPQRQLRKIDAKFVKGLKERTGNDPLAPGTASLALLCHKDYVDEKCKFKVNLANQYKYEVLIRLHTITARKQLLAEP